MHSVAETCRLPPHFWLGWLTTNPPPRTSQVPPSQSVAETWRLPPHFWPGWLAPSPPLKRRRYPLPKVSQKPVGFSRSFGPVGLPQPTHKYHLPHASQKPLGCRCMLSPSPKETQVSIAKVSQDLLIVAPGCQTYRQPKVLHAPPTQIVTGYQPLAHNVPKHQLNKWVPNGFSNDGLCCML